MKKQLFLLLLFAFFSIGVAVAQSEWAFGPRLGVGFSTRAGGFPDYYSVENSYCANLVGGVFGEYKYRNFAVELDVLFTKQGFSGDREKATKDPAWLIPLKFKYYMPFLKGLNVFAGPQLDIFPDRHYRILPPPGGSGLAQDYRKTQASITVGLGYRFKFGLDLAVNYNAGIVSNLRNKDISDDNKVFQVTVGYSLNRLFKLSKK